MRLLPLVLTLAAAPASGATLLLQDGAELPHDNAGAATSALLAVDSKGNPVAGVSLVLDLTPIGAFGDALANRIIRTDENGRAALPDTRLGVLDVLSDSPDWAVSFLHARRIEDTEAAPDLLQRHPVYLDLASAVVCVMERTGTIELTIEGAAADEEYHVVFQDERPEPEVHRAVRRAASFTGSKGSFRAPSGRGTLYIARDGALGSTAVGPNGPLLVQVHPGGTSRVALRAFAGPETLMLAPFGSIPFRAVEALAPDGATVVADLAFETSPLRIPSTLFAAVADGAPSADALGRMRLGHHLLRATDVPLQRPPMPPREGGEGGAAERFVDPPPMELIFSIDAGGKLRLPEVEGGWIQLAQTGSMIVAGSDFARSQGLTIQRTAPGQVERAAANDDAVTWRAQVQLNTTDGAPRSFAEVIVAEPRSLPFRALADDQGQLVIRGLQADRVRVAFVDDTGASITIERPAEAEAGSDASGAAATLSERPIGCSLQGHWHLAPETAAFGGYVTILPKEDALAQAERAFGTRGMRIAVVDADGAFRFDAVPSGAYRVQTSDGGWVEIALDGGETKAEHTLNLAGRGNTLRAETFR